MSISVLFRAVALPPLALGAAIFLAAGTTQYWQAWLYLALFAGAYVGVMGYFAVRSPAVVRRRVGAVTGERSLTQKVMVVGIELAILVVFALPGLDHRLGWSKVPPGLVLVGDGLLVVSFVVLFLVFRHNAFAGSTVTVEASQQVVSSGPYALVRHPMYAAGLLLALGTSPALGSWWGWMALVAVVPALLLRLRDEERFLRGHLAGYVAYCEQVRWRLVPRLY